MKYIASEKDVENERKPWILVWLPLTLALLVSMLNILIQRRAYATEGDHFPILNLELQFAQINGMVDVFSQQDSHSKDSLANIYVAERSTQHALQDLVHANPQYFPGLLEAGQHYHAFFLREMALFSHQELNAARKVDDAQLDPAFARIQRLLMGSHNRVREVTSRTQTTETILSTFSIFGMAFGMVVIFLGIEAARRRVANTIHLHLKKNNERLEIAVEERTKEIQHQAFHDRLTGLANRALFMDRIAFALLKAQRTRLGTAALFLDLDNFKLVNDSLGHASGDDLLIAVSDRLLQAVRPGDTVARMGGDEFTILLEDLDSVEQAEAIAARVLQALRKPIALHDREAFALGSIGIAYADQPSATPEELMKNADAAMYQAKANGRARYVVWDESLKDLAMERLELETDLRNALDRDEISINYQPLIDLETGVLIGAEALARWRHPTRGLISPNCFIPIAEESGMIIPIGRFILESACRQASKWISEFHLDNFLLSVNLSGRQLQSSDIVDNVAVVLQETGLEPRSLKIEVTESVFMANQQDIISKMEQFHKLGVKIALDDFGTGYSSLSRLSIFPVDTLKIDRSFVSHLGDEDESSSLVQAIIGLSKSLQMDVIGEGVETEKQMSVLRTLGCRVGQGFLFAQPLAADDFAGRLAWVSDSAGQWTNADPVLASEFAA